METSFKNVICNRDIHVSTTNGEDFGTCRLTQLWALVYVRFGRKLDQTIQAMARLLQSDPIERSVAAPLIAAGLAIQEDDERSYASQCTTEEEHLGLMQNLYTGYLNKIIR